ncbi:MAG TPA: Uma2 family endonuclease [Bacillales bacterium]|nr:Uma2 family endonuclease [Bacillales bacterium]
MGEPVFRKKYTYTDYLEWPEGERVELIDGQPVYMSPAPSRKHQVVSRELIRKFGNYLDGNRCEVFDAPFDVRLFAEARENDEVENVVQPDLVVFCDPEKLDDKGGKGTPDLVIEILSTSTAKIDKLTKKSLYEKAGVKEYWVVDPVHELLEVYLLKDDGKYGEYQLYSKEDTVPVNIFPDLTIDLDKIFLP